MAAPSAETASRLATLVAALPSSSAFKLAQGAGLFTPVAPLVRSRDEQGRKRYGRISPAAIRTLWTWGFETAAREEALSLLSMWLVGTVDPNVQVSGDSRARACVRFAKKALDAISSSKGRARVELSARFGGDDIFDDAIDAAVGVAHAELLGAVVDAFAIEEASVAANRLAAALAEVGDHQMRFASLVLARVLHKAPLAQVVRDVSAVLSHRGLSRVLEGLGHRVAALVVEELVFDAPEAASGGASLEWTPEAWANVLARVDARRARLAELGAAFPRPHDKLIREAIPRATRRLGETIAASVDTAADLLVAAVDPATDPETRASGRIEATADALLRLQALAASHGCDQAVAASIARIRACLDDAALDACVEAVRGIEDEDDPEVQAAEARARVVAAINGLEDAGQLRRRLLTSRGLADPQSLFFELLTPLMVSDRAPTRRARIKRKEIDAVWRWIEAEAPQQHAAVVQLVERIRYLGPEDAALVAVRELTAEALAGRKVEGVSDETVSLIVALLRYDRSLRETFASWPPSDLSEFTNGHAAAMETLVVSIEARDPGAGLAALLLASARMRRPAQVLRALVLIARSNSDLLLENTEYAKVGDVLLDEAEDLAVAFGGSSRPDFDPLVAIPALVRYAMIVSGMTEEFMIRPSGRWGTRLYQLISRAARELESICDQAARAIEAATPQVRAGAARALRPDVSKPVDLVKLERAIGFARFLTESRSFDSRAAFSSERANAARLVEARLRTHETLLVDALRETDPHQREAAASHLTQFARLIAIFDGEETAQILMKRARLAAAAA